MPPSLFVYAQRFAAVIMRIRDPKTTALVFRSGKLVITGAKSEEQVIAPPWHTCALASCILDNVHRELSTGEECVAEVRENHPEARLPSGLH